MMKTIKKTALLIGCLFMVVSLWNCAKADPEFIHPTNTISQMTCQAAHTAGQFLGDIYEYNSNSELVTGAFTQADVEGGYGLIVFAIPLSQQNDIDLTRVYLKATVTWDEIITPSLSGRHNITGEGIIITVTSGVGTTRQYRIRGSYE
ncbi:MAG: hypothetical protein LBS12_05855 [Prevotellaceae bacterium]|nr:hypothetical protein [Prevotellaceae bacterium]